MSTLSPTLEPSLAPSIGAADLSQYLWFTIAAGIICFGMAWGIGANDVANAFSTSIGAKAVTIKQAVLIASVFEFLGALLLGGTVTDTVRKKIVNYEEFENEPELLMLGMFSALVSGAFWLAIASKYSLPVSTTHTVIGSIIGFAWVSKGINAIDWNALTLIISFWLAAPIMCGIVAIIFYLPLRTFLLRRKDSYKWTLRIWPFFVFLVFFIMSFFLMIKSSARLTTVKHWSEKGSGKFHYIVLISLGIGAGVALIAGLVFLVPWSCLGTGKGMVENFVDEKVKARNKKNEIKQQKDEEERMTPDKGTPRLKTHVASESGVIDVENLDVNKSRFEMLGDKLTYGMNVDIHEGLETLEHKIHTMSEPFKFETEKAFGWLQVLTATLDIFAHGSNDVANAIAPFAAIIYIYKNGIISDGDGKVEVYWWILALGGAGMTIGLATYGYNIMKVLGVRMAAMSSTRGYCIELSSALIIIICSHNGLPASTTHAQVGSTLGVGLCELCYHDNKLTWKNIVNWKLLAQVFLGWILTLVIGAAVSAGVYSFIAYSPCAN